MPQYFKKRGYYQVGKSDTVRDGFRKAFKPGKRTTKHRTIYYEYRKNRSDMPGDKI